MIEQLWVHLECKRSERFGIPNSEGILKGQLTKTWGTIPQSVINNFVGSFPERVKKCAAGQGRIVVKL